MPGILFFIRFTLLNIWFSKILILNYREIWSAWLDFENNAGDLESISKVLKKREQFYDDSNQLEECQTLLLIDRFKFMNLYPCDQRELKLLGYNDLVHNYSSLATSLTALTNSITNNINLPSKDINEEKEAQSSYETVQSTNPFNSRFNIQRPRYPAPEISKMYPFKPNRGSLNGLQPLPCGNALFLFPTIFSDLLKRLPPPSSFNVILEFHFIQL
jgi:hypothetical protein